MYEIIRLTETASYAECPARVGIADTGENEVCLIDSGSDRSAAKKILSQIRERGLTVRAVYDTHYHADHTGGSAYIAQQTGAAVYLPDMECGFGRYPVLESCFLYGGNSPKDLRHKFLMAQPCDARPLTADDLPGGLRAVPLPGHSPAMTGFVTKDGAAYIADSVAAEPTLAKYGLTFLTDPGAYLDTLEKLPDIGADWYIPSHAEPVRDIRPLAKINADSVYAAADRICALCAQPRGFDSLLGALFTDMGLAMSPEQHALTGCTVRGYLTWLRESGRMEALFENNVLMWHRI